MNLENDIIKGSDWIIKCFQTDGFKLDYSIESFKSIDKFISMLTKDGKILKNSRLDIKNYGTILFSIGSYVGETIIKNIPGSHWEVDDTGKPEDDINIRIILPDKSKIFPVQRIAKRVESEENGIFTYGNVLFNEYINK